MNEKIAGYLLIILGIMAMVFPLISVYQVATARTQPVKVFNFPGINIDLSQMAQPDMENLTPEQQAQYAENSKNLKTEIIGGEILSTPLNYFLHFVFMGFIMNFGVKLASLGVNLVRVIKVNLKGSEAIEKANL